MPLPALLLPLPPMPPLLPLPALLLPLPPLPQPQLLPLPPQPVTAVVPFVDLSLPTTVLSLLTTDLSLPSIQVPIGAGLAGTPAAEVAEMTAAAILRLAARQGACRRLRRVLSFVRAGCLVGQALGQAEGRG